MHKSIACVAFQSTAFQRAEMNVNVWVFVWMYSVYLCGSLWKYKEKIQSFYKVGLSSINYLTLDVVELKCCHMFRVRVKYFSTQILQVFHTTHIWQKEYWLLDFCFICDLCSTTLLTVDNGPYLLAKCCWTASYNSCFSNIKWSAPTELTLSV